VSHPTPTTRSTVFFTGKDKVELVSEPVPQPTAGELLIETAHTLISTGTEGICLSRDFGPGTNWDKWVSGQGKDFRPGYLNVGRVLAAGSAVTGWAKGDRVATRGGHTSHFAWPAASAVRIPEQVAGTDAAWMGLGKITQIGVRAAQHQLGDVVAVVGLGLLGQLIVQYVRLLGAREIIAIDTAPKRLAMAEAHGATRTLKMTAAEALARVNDVTGGRRADVVYDATGHPAVFAAALPLARRFGTVILIGDAGHPEQQHLSNDLIIQGLRIVGAHEMHPSEQATDHDPWSATRMYELFLTYLARGQMRVSDLVTHHYKPQDAAETYAMLRRERENAMGVIFDWL